MNSSMNTLSYKTISANKQTVKKEWVLIDAENLVVGRLASEVAKILRGKNKPYYTPHVDCGDHVVIINAEKIRFTGKKMDDKKYVSYSGYPGGQRSTTPKKIIKTRSRAGYRKCHQRNASEKQAWQRIIPQFACLCR